MKYNDFLNRVIDDGIRVGSTQFTISPCEPSKEGFLAGLNACKDKEPEDLKEMLEESKSYMDQSGQSFMSNDKEADTLLWFLSYHGAIIRVCDAISAFMICCQYKTPIFSPSTKGIRLAKIIINENIHRITNKGNEGQSKNN